MSVTQTAPADAGAPDTAAVQKAAGDARDMVLQAVFVPQFLQKMASLGYAAETDAQALELLKIAEMLENVPDEAVFGKQAMAARNPYKIASDELAGHLGLSQKQAAAAAQNTAWTTAGEYLKQQPQLYNAALLLAAAG